MISDILHTYFQLDNTDLSEVYSTTVADDEDDEYGSGGDSEKHLVDNLCFNVMICVSIMVIVMALGTAALWTAQKIMLAAENGGISENLVTMSAFTGAGMDLPFLTRLESKRRMHKVTHPKDISSMLTAHLAAAAAKAKAIEEEEEENQRRRHKDQKVRRRRRRGAEDT